MLLGIIDIDLKINFGRNVYLYKVLPICLNSPVSLNTPQSYSCLHKLRNCFIILSFKLKIYKILAIEEG